MIIKPLIKNIQIELAEIGFYKGLNKFITICSKVLITALVLWAAISPDHALSILQALNTALLNAFNVYYLYVVSFFLIFCIGMAVVPSVGKLKLGQQNEKARVFKFLLVFNDVWRRYGDRFNGFFYSRAALAFW